MPDAFTKVSLGAVDDAAPGNGFGDRWEARVARNALGAERTGVTLFRLLPGKRSPFTHRHTDAEEIHVVLSGKPRAADGGDAPGRCAQRRPRAASRASRHAARRPGAWAAGVAALCDGGADRPGRGR